MAVVNQAELLGVMGLSWQDKLSKAMRATDPLSKATPALVDTLGNIYTSLLSSGKFVKPVFTGQMPDEAGRKTMKELMARSQANGSTVRAFLYNLQGLAVKGDIDRAHYDPVGYKADKAASNALNPTLLSKIGAGATEGIGQYFKTARVVVIGGAVIAAVIAAMVYLPKPKRG